MIIWVDADACPGPIKDIIVRACHRLKIASRFVANKQLNLPSSDYTSFIQVDRGPDIADAFIHAHAQAGDLVITQDIPLAAKLIDNDISVISPRGDLYTKDNIAENLSRRNFLQDLRDQGQITGGPSAFDEKVKRQFANYFDAELQRLSRKK